MFKEENKVHDEMLACVDENGIITGEAVSRKEAHEKGVLHGASHIYLFRRTNAGKTEFLLQRRSHNKDSFADCLDISSAGHVEAGMNYEETALKELKEELGIVPETGELRFAFSQRIRNKSEQRGKVFDDNEIDKVYLLEKDPDLSKLILQTEEVSEVIWMSSDEIEKRLDENDIELCIEKDEFQKVYLIVKGLYDPDCGAR